MGQMILHVDDDPDIRHAVATILAGEGYEVMSFTTVKDALRAVANRRPDLILLDVMVEEQDSGLAAYDILAEKYPTIPSVILTSLGEMIMPYFVDRKEMVWILEKPIVAERLVHTVRSRLSSMQ
jgi:DNA-binding NtrC family response regulator